MLLAYRDVNKVRPEPKLLVFNMETYVCQRDTASHFPNNILGWNLAFWLRGRQRRGCHSVTDLLSAVQAAAGGEALGKIILKKGDFCLLILAN